MGINILAIDTSCDETSAAVIEDGRRVVSNIISSQIEFHAKYGGVVPEAASRKHIENIDLVVMEALSEAGLSLKDVDAVSATFGPGLVGALLTGLLYAKGLSYAANKPFIGINHIEGHICSNYLDSDFTPPFICLIASGGHTNLVLVKDYGVYEVLGKTRDDAAGEAFDKVARVLGLPYPGGPRLEKIAREGDENAISFPKAYIDQSSYDFSFSGVKSSVINYLNKCNMMNVPVNNADVAASFQKAVVDVLVDKTVMAVTRLGIKKAALAGGVAANGKVRERLNDELTKLNVSLRIPKHVYCTDNGAMIGAAAYYKFIKGGFSAMDLNAEPSLKL